MRKFSPVLKRVQLLVYPMLLLLLACSWLANPTPVPSQPDEAGTDTPVETQVPASTSTPEPRVRRTPTPFPTPDIPATIDFLLQETLSKVEPTQTPLPTSVVVPTAIPKSTEAPTPEPTVVPTVTPIPRTPTPTPRYQAFQPGDVGDAGVDNFIRRVKFIQVPTGLNLQRLDFIVEMIDFGFEPTTVFLYHVQSIKQPYNKPPDCTREQPVVFFRKDNEYGYKKDFETVRWRYCSSSLDYYYRNEVPWLEADTWNYVGDNTTVECPPNRDTYCPTVDKPDTFSFGASWRNADAMNNTFNSINSDSRWLIIIFSGSTMIAREFIQ